MTSPGKTARASQFSLPELEVLISTYAENEQIIWLRGNTVTAAQKRETAWQKIADRVNA